MSESPTETRIRIALEKFPKKHYTDEVRNKCEKAMEEHSKVLTIKIDDLNRQLSNAKQSLFIQSETMRNITDQSDEAFDMLDKCYTALVKNKNTRHSHLAYSVYEVLKRKNKR